MLFLLDHDVDAAVGRMLRRRQHDCHTAGDVGLEQARDDALTVCASQHGAVVVSTDREFGQRRMKTRLVGMSGCDAWIGKPWTSWPSV